MAGRAARVGRAVVVGRAARVGRAVVVGRAARVGRAVVASRAARVGRAVVAGRIAVAGRVAAARRPRGQRGSGFATMPAGTPMFPATRTPPRAHSASRPQLPSVPAVSVTVRPGAFCAFEGSWGRDADGRLLRCTRTPGGQRLRWRLPAEPVPPPVESGAASPVVTPRTGPDRPGVWRRPVTG
jgi:hypothetical protein